MRVMTDRPPRIRSAWCRSRLLRRRRSPCNGRSLSCRWSRAFPFVLLLGRQLGDQQADAHLDLVRGADEGAVAGVIVGALDGGIRHAPVRGGRVAGEVRADL